MFGRWKNEAPKNSFWVSKSLRPVIVCFVRFRRFGCETRPIICLHSLDCEQASEGDGTSKPLYQDLIYFPKQFSVFFCLRKCRGSKIAIFIWNSKCASMPWLSGDHLSAWCLCNKEKGSIELLLRFTTKSTIIGQGSLVSDNEALWSGEETILPNIKSLTVLFSEGQFWHKKHTVWTIWWTFFLIFFFPV